MYNILFISYIHSVAVTGRMGCQLLLQELGCAIRCCIVYKLCISYIHIVAVTGRMGCQLLMRELGCAIRCSQCCLPVWWGTPIPMYTTPIVTPLENRSCSMTTSSRARSWILAASPRSNLKDSLNTGVGIFCLTVDFHFFVRLPLFSNQILT